MRCSNDREEALHQFWITQLNNREQKKIKWEIFHHLLYDWNLNLNDAKQMNPLRAPRVRDNKQITQTQYSYLWHCLPFRIYARNQDTIIQYISMKVEKPVLQHNNYLLDLSTSDLEEYRIQYIKKQSNVNHKNVWIIFSINIYKKYWRIKCF